MKSQLIIILISTFTFLGCSQRIDFENEFMTNQLVVNAIVAADSLIRVDVYRNTSINEVFYKQVPDADVSIWQNGKKLETLRLDNTLIRNSYKHQDDTVFFYITTSTKALPGNTYRLEVKHPEFETAFCETTVPQPVQIDRIDTSSIYELGSNMESLQFNFVINFSDPIENSNYYRLLVYLQYGKQWQTVTYNDTTHYIHIYDQELISIQSKDPVFINENEDADNEILGGSLNSYDAFSDELFQGESYKLHFYDLSKIIWSGNNKDSEPWFKIEPGEFYHFTIELQSISRESYLYFKSVDSQQSVDDLPFIEPVPVFNNVENGMGIFGSYSSSRVEVTFGEYPVEGIEYR